jgi:hypothetical protein
VGASEFLLASATGESPGQGTFHRRMALRFTFRRRSLGALELCQLKAVKSKRIGTVRWRCETPVKRHKRDIQPGGKMGSLQRVIGRARLPIIYNFC